MAPRDHTSPAWRRGRDTRFGPFDAAPIRLRRIVWPRLWREIAATRVGDRGVVWAPELRHNYRDPGTGRSGSGCFWPARGGVALRSAGKLRACLRTYRGGVRPRRRGSDADPSQRCTVKGQVVFAV